MNHVVYDDRLCKVEIVRCLTGYGWFVIVDEDPEHYHSQACISWDEAMSTAEEVRADMAETCGQFGVGA